MSQYAIRAERLSKQYRIGGPRQQYETLRDALTRAATAPFQRFRIGARARSDDNIVWALQEVSFAIEQGEVVGIIGRNGAGKSTLLKILSRITAPSGGTVQVRGRVASLLEVGTGFHPELTGRENIFLNGAILGMTRREVRKKFEEMVDFAGVERFIDTPVKHYSSGMHMRLAFAVAAHLETDILLVDEVLAVGDHEFQQKCLGKMQDVASKGGRSVLLVSHNLAAINEMVDRALLLHSGRISFEGSPSEVISAYLSRGAARPTYEARPTMRTGAPKVNRIEVLTSDPTGVHQFGEPLEIKFLISHHVPMSKACFSFQIVDQNLRNVVHAWAFHPQQLFGDSAGETELSCRFPAIRLNVSRYHLRTHLTETPEGEVYERLDGVCPFEVIRTKDTVMWGWHPEDCVYHEDWTWTVHATGVEQLDQTN